MLKALADLLLLVSPGGSLFAQQRRSLLRHAPPGVMKLRGGADAVPEALPPPVQQWMHEQSGSATATRQQGEFQQRMNARRDRFSRKNPLVRATAEKLGVRGASGHVFFTRESDQAWQEELHGYPTVWGLRRKIYFLIEDLRAKQVNSQEAELDEQME